MTERVYKFSDEARLRMSLAHKGKPQTRELVEKRAAALRGRPLNAETKRKLRDAALRRKGIDPSTHVTQKETKDANKELRRSDPVTYAAEMRRRLIEGMLIARANDSADVVENRRRQLLEAWKVGHDERVSKMRATLVLNAEITCQRPCTKCGGAPDECKFNYVREKSGALRKSSWCRQCAQELSKHYPVNKNGAARSSNKWALTHPLQSKAIRASRRAKRRGLEATLTAQHWESIKNASLHRCLRCGRHENERPLTQDHVVPLSRSGGHTPDNVQPLCRNCNAKKSTKTTDYRKVEDCAFI